MRTVAEGPVVCDRRSGQESPSVTHFDQTAHDTNHSGPFGAFTLGVLANDPLMLNREGSDLTVDVAAPSELVVHSAPPTPTQAVDQDIKHKRVTLPTIPPTDMPVEPTPNPPSPHGPSNQPSTSALLKTFPSSIRTRVRSFTDAQPLAFRWKFPPNKRYRIKDSEAFAALREKNIEWYVTTGLLIEDCLGLKWAAGDYTYLLYWHDECMPIPEVVDGTGRALSIGSGFVREWQVGRWKEGVARQVLEDRPATPIIGEDDLMGGSVFPWETVGRVPSTPGTVGALPLRPRSALSNRQDQGVPESSLLLSVGSDLSLLNRGKKVRLRREKRHRIVELAVDDKGVPLEEKGKVLERQYDGTTVLTDNEGKTVRSWLGLG